MKIFDKIKKNKGFVILFAVTIAAILLSIALGVSNIALKELQFSTSAKNTNDAFFAADTGAECALLYDNSNWGYFPVGGPATAMSCASQSITPSFNAATDTYTFSILQLGASGQACASVTVFKDNSNPPKIATTITSKGYNTINVSGLCSASSNSNAVERDLQVSY